MHNLPCWPLAAGCEWSLIDAQQSRGEEAEQEWPIQFEFNLDLI